MAKSEPRRTRLVHMFNRFQLTSRKSLGTADIDISDVIVVVVVIMVENYTRMRHITVYFYSFYQSQEKNLVNTFCFPVNLAYSGSQLNSQLTIFVH